MKAWKWWDQLPEDLRKALLILAVVQGGASVSCRLVPVVCDPPPPPSTTPMICDPPPPPSDTPSPTIQTPTPTATPMICDPPPPPATVAPAPPATVAPGQSFDGQVVDVSSDANVAGAAIQGTVVDGTGQPLPGMVLVVQQNDWQARTVGDSQGGFSLEVPMAGTYALYIEGAEANALGLILEQHDVVTVEWVEVQDSSRLPLAEIRTIKIVRQGSLTFVAESPWSDARCHWNVSGGRLVKEGEGVVWHPPAEAGRYLLEVVADWGWQGVAVDALVLVVQDDGQLISDG